MGGGCWKFGVFVAPLLVTSVSVSLLTIQRAPHTLISQLLCITDAFVPPMAAQPGQRVHPLILRADRPDTAPVSDPYSTVVLQRDRSHVDTVLVPGSGRGVRGRPSLRTPVYSTRPTVAGEGTSLSRGPTAATQRRRAPRLSYTRRPGRDMLGH